MATDVDWEDFDGFDNFGISICTSATRPTGGALHEGRFIYETDTNKTYYYTGSAWVELGTGGGDFYADGSVPMTGNLQMGTNKITGLVDPTANQEAATKKYVDDNAGVSVHSSLSNLAWSVAGHSINADISPTTNQTIHLGSASNAFNTIYVDSLSNFTTDAQIECLKNFDMNAHDIYDVDGLYLNSGATMYLTDDSGDMKLHVATGKKVKIVVG